MKLIVACSAMLAAAGKTPAQTTSEINSGVQFNFSTPGARSLGLGGAFLGLADDATAAYANPAGLTVLSEPEVSFEIRRWTFKHTFTNGGRLFGDPTGIGIDTVSGLRTGRAENTVDGLSFLSAVYPRRRWAVALYRHELANYEAGFRTPGNYTFPDTRTRPRINSFRLEIANVGLSAAFRLTDRLSLGAGLSSYDFTLRSRTDRYHLAAGSGPGGLYGPPLYTSDNLDDTQIQSGDDRKTGFNAGFLWKVADGWTFGGVYRQGPEFEFDATYIPGPGALPTAQQTTRRARYNTPDVFGIGIAAQPTELVTVNLDYVRIRYSDLTRSVINILLPRPTEFNPRELRNFKVEDAGEIHLGFERIFPRQESLLAARVGAWYDPDHRIRYVGTIPGFQSDFRRGKSEVHYSAGLGLIRWHSRLSGDAAFDYSDAVKTASLSTIVRF